MVIFISSTTTTTTTTTILLFALCWIVWISPSCYLSEFMLGLQACESCFLQSFWIPQSDACCKKQHGNREYMQLLPRLKLELQSCSGALCFLLRMWVCSQSIVHQSAMNSREPLQWVVTRLKNATFCKSADEEAICWDLFKHNTPEKRGASCAPHPPKWAVYGAFLALQYEFT